MFVFEIFLAYNFLMIKAFCKQAGVIFLFSAVVLLMTACSAIISSTTGKMADNLSYTILNSDDPQTIADGAPAYLLLMDSLLRDASDNPALLQSAATLYSAYAGIFVTDTQRAIRMSNKAFNYAQQALCIENRHSCDLKKMDYTAFSALVDTIDQQNIHAWYVLASSWAGWIKANSGSVAAIADLAKVTRIMERISELDDSMENGQVHLYLGVLKTLLPPALGGKPEQGQFHFKRAIAISPTKNLTAKVLYAEKYARLVFAQDLHDKLLHEVIDADPYYENMTLMNILAQKKAQQLLDTSQDYF